MSRNFHEQSEGLFPASGLPVLPNEVHFAMLHPLPAPADWKNYIEVYPHLATDDYFWKKLMVKFPNLTAAECRRMNWVEATQRVNFNFTLNHAVETNNVQLLKQILNYGGNVYQMDKRNNLIFFSVIRQKKFDMVRLFLNKGFNINTIHKKKTALMLCVGDNNMESANFLLENGASIDVIKGGRSAIFSAFKIFCCNYFKFQNDDMLTLLTDFGADYNLKHYYLDIPLTFLILELSNYIKTHRLTDASFIKRIFSRFIENTNMTHRDVSRKTLLHELCSNYERGEVREIVVDLYKYLIAAFLDAGIPVNATAVGGVTPYDLVAYQDATIREFLRQKGGLSREELEQIELYID